MRVGGFDKSLGSRGNTAVVRCAVAYDCPETFQTYILFFNEALYLPTMKTNLLCPFQMRSNGVQLADVPLQHLPAADRTPSSHTISVPEKGLHIPLELRGTMSGCTVRKPTQAEVDDKAESEVTHVEMTSSIPWEPHDPAHSTEEDLLRRHLSNDIDLREKQSRDIFEVNSSPHQVRGQDQGDPLEVDSPLDDEAVESELESLLQEPVEAPAEPLEIELQSILRGPHERGHGKVTFTTPLCDVLIFDPQATAAEPMLPLRLLSAVQVERDKGRFHPTEIDSCAKSLLMDMDAADRSLRELTTYKKRSGHVTPERLARNWGIGLEAAKRTILNTTQLAVRDFSGTTGTRRLKPYADMLKLKRLKSELYTDTMFAKCKSLRGNTCAQIYVANNGWIYCVPMKKESDAHLSLDDLFRDYGVPIAIIPDGAKSLNQGKYQRKCRRSGCRIKPVEAYTPNANLAEGNIGWVKTAMRQVMIKKNIPELVWDWCLETECKIRRNVALNLRQLDGRTPEAAMTGETPDISHLAEFGFYDYVWYISPQGKPGVRNDIQRKRLGRYLGPSDSAMEAMCGVVLTEKATWVERTSIFPLSVEDENSESIKRMKAIYEETLKEKLKERAKELESGKDTSWLPDLDEDMQAANDLLEKTPERVEYEPYSMEELGYADYLPSIPEESPYPLPELAEADDLDFNSYIAAKVKLPVGGHTFANGKVIGRARDECGELIGKSHSNPLLDTSVYEVRFEDGAVERCSANIIAEGIYSQVDKDGTTLTYLDEVVGHKSDPDAVQKEDGFIASHNGNKIRKQTTKGWWLLVELKNGSTEYVKLKDLKESNPIQVAEYARDNGLLEEPAFAWWAPWTLKQIRRTLKAMQTRYHRTTSKFGIELPKTVKRALEIDKETGTTFWRDAMEKEMKTVMVAFDILPEDAPKPTARSFLRCHLVFDIKAGSLRRKARFCADGSRIDPGGNTYASVVSRESVRLGFMLAALNGLDVMAADIEGAYLNAQTTERVYTCCGPEFGECEGR